MFRLRVSDSDARANRDVHGRSAFTNFEPAASVQGAPAEASVEAEGLPDLTRPGEQDGPILAAAPPPNRAMPGDGLAGANQNRSGLPVDIGHEIEHLVQAVTQIDVRVPWRPPHRGISPSQPGTAVVRTVVGVSVRLDFGNAKTDPAAPDFVPQEVASDFEGVTRVEPGGKKASRHGPSLYQPELPCQRQPISSATPTMSS